ncbi:MAG: cytochrome c [Gammaproteobacteria bacterium]|nr:cytochrome c [Gammaproteobacteria bacterium]
MFRLRRAMQAVEEYAAQEDRPGMEKWARRLVKDYRRIPEMVPEWADEIELEWADRLAASAAQGQTGKIARALRKLGQTCKSCHRQFRAVTAALFRTPDYHEIQVEDPLGKVPYPKAMKQLGRSLNRIKIGIEDERWQAAREAGDAFTSQLRELGNSCKNCHRDAVPRERILGAGTADVLAELTTAIERREAQNARKLLGRAAVQICARCHGIHRTLADLKHAVKSAKE